MTEQHVPAFPLNRFVETIWVGRTKQIDLQISLHASLFTELIFNYGDQFEVEGQNVSSLEKRGVRQIISGLKTAPFKTTVLGEYQSIGLILKPFCYGYLQGKLDTLTMDELADQLGAAVLFSEQADFAQAESLLLRFFQSFEPDPDLLRFEHECGPESLRKGVLKGFGKSLPISQKSFIHKFKQHYHLTPGQYVKLRQVNHAVALIESRRYSSMTQIGLEAGFYDQPHFNRVFKQHCGTSPRKFCTSFEPTAM